MKDKIIWLIKKYRAESERYWHQIIGYQGNYGRGYSTACDHFVNDLEELLKSEERAIADV